MTLSQRDYLILHWVRRRRVRERRGEQKKRKERTLIEGLLNADVLVGGVGAAAGPKAIERGRMLTRTVAVGRTAGPDLVQVETGPIAHFLRPPPETPISRRALQRRPLNVALHLYGDAGGLRVDLLDGRADLVGRLASRDTHVRRRLTIGDTGLVIDLIAVDGADVDCYTVLRVVELVEPLNLSSAPPPHGGRI